ncbi:hypothetical protein M9Y10_024387 [Tritrichomonas musculus]|uniref:Uncharacterized protein n=1 Tax=Tritrichomonas musculus TaxID=1915356 RepID=A0ABR2HBV2_9EUKA
MHDIKDLQNRDFAEGQCRTRAILKYGIKDGFQKWKEDGERFMQRSFLYSDAFPIINDGKIELDEWLEEMKVTSLFYHYWEPYQRLSGIIKFLKKLMKFYKKQRKKELKPYVKVFSMIIKAIEKEIIEQDAYCLNEGEEEEEEEEELEYKDEKTQIDT